MLREPRGEKRPSDADSMGCAIQVVRIAIGEEEDTRYAQPNKRWVDRYSWRKIASGDRDHNRCAAFGDCKKAASARWE